MYICYFFTSDLKVFEYLLIYIQNIVLTLFSYISILFQNFRMHCSNWGPNSFNNKNRLYRLFLRTLHIYCTLYTVHRLDSGHTKSQTKTVQCAYCTKTLLLYWTQTFILYWTQTFILYWTSTVQCTQNCMGCTVQYLDIEQRLSVDFIQTV